MQSRSSGRVMYAMHKLVRSDPVIYYSSVMVNRRVEWVI